MTGSFWKPLRLARLSIAALALAVPIGAAQADEPVAAPMPPGPLDVRIQELLPLLKGEFSYDNYFDDSFKAAIPPAKWKEITDGLTAQFGQPVGLADVQRDSASTATVRVAYEKGIGTFALMVNGNGDVFGLLIKGFSATNDSIEQINAAFAALPGATGFVVEELNANGGARILAERNADDQFAIGSTFKLYILAELAAEIQAGERKWSDVTTLPHHTYSATAINRWPDDSQVTLQSLATWMISGSDNRATDNLLYLLGRERVEGKLAMIGHSNPGKALPFLSTVEAFALKSAGNAKLRDEFLKASEEKQRDLINDNADKLGFDQVDPSTFSGAPVYIDSLEWFASPKDIGLVLNNIRQLGSKEALNILAVNPGVITPGSKWKYVGYKGGSEPGVISMSYLLQTPSGKWLVVSGSWNDKEKAVDESKFSMLMARLADKFAE